MMDRQGPLPMDCPECGSSDTGEQHEDPTSRECYRCEAFWYVSNARAGTWDSCPGTVRAEINAYSAAAEDRELFGDVMDY